MIMDRRPLPLACHPSVTFDDLEPGDPWRAHLEEVERRLIAAVAEPDRLERRPAVVACRAAGIHHRHGVPRRPPLSQARQAS